MKTITKFINALFAIATVATSALTANADPGDIFVSDRVDGIIYKFTPDGTQSTFAAELNVPQGLGIGQRGLPLRGMPRQR